MHSKDDTVGVPSTQFVGRGHKTPVSPVHTNESSLEKPPRFRRPKQGDAHGFDDLNRTSRWRKNKGTNISCSRGSTPALSFLCVVPIARTPTKKGAQWMILLWLYRNIDRVWIWYSSVWILICRKSQLISMKEAKFKLISFFFCWLRNEILHEIIIIIYKRWDAINILV